MNIFAIIGRLTLDGLAALGRLSLFASHALRHLVLPPLFLKNIGQQMMVIGYNSLPVVGLTALFTGAALAQQIYVGSERFNAESTMAAVVVIAIVRELGPVLGGLMVAGRVSSAMAAEIGTMRVTEQIDALVTLSTNPYKYLVVPRLIAGVITLPGLVIVANIIGVFGGFLVATQRLGFNPGSYLTVTMNFLEVTDIVSSLVKAAVFGFVIALMGCYHGYYSTGGAQGVGRATTNAVVSAFILILLANLIITITVFQS
ncbi:ABC transporter permease [Iodidimonas nitroreducens]|uniref:ABC transporter permease n=1 Tax=Iodidimonas nitroreducens TaxID=1236968 RepID=A0A5A7N5J8_9PROT|nr:ABC transporter permease [Iodidimonas nitroreducens]GAK32790.1 putative ABC transporter permease protein [alpha proteobacterium Q-1]GER02925.1 ABC transporter permease [Iodidimonas nitroreducens]